MNTFDRYRSRLADMRIARDIEDDETYGPDALSIERETVYRIVLGTGGPHDEVAIRVRDGEVIGGQYVYAWSGMDGDGTYELSRDEAEEWADAFAIPDVF